MDERKIESIVEKEYSRERLDKYLAQRFDYRTRSRWQKVIRCGGLRINSRVVSNPSYKIKEGDVILLTSRLRDEPEVDRRYELLFEDDVLLGVSKSGDIPVHPAGPYYANTLMALLEKDCGYPVYPVHRLDRETSGVILFAKEAGAAAKISGAWGEVEKKYLLLVKGEFDKPVICSMPIGPAYSTSEMRDDVVRKKRLAYDGAPESARTSFFPQESGSRCSLVSAVLHTGRQHQIRVHCRFLGYPIIGDKIYGDDERYYLEFIRQGMSSSLLEKTGMRRCALHSSRISLLHPVTNKKIEIFADLPSDMRAYMYKKRVT